MEAQRIIDMDSIRPTISRKKKIGRLISLILVLSAAAAIALFFLFQGSSEMVTVKSYTTARVYRGELASTTEASGTVVLPTQVTIVSSSEGYADELLVQEGSVVSPADVLASLDVPDLEDQRDELALSLDQALIDLESVETDYTYQIKTLELKLQRLAGDMVDAREDVATFKSLAELKSSRQSDYEAALDALEALTEQQEDLQLSLEEAKLKMDISLRKQRASIAQMRSKLENIEEDIDETRITSPIAGEVLSINEDLAIPGSLINKADPLFVVADRSEAYIDFDVYEEYSDQLQAGGEMTVTIGSTTMKAEIVKIGKIATMDNDGLSAMVSVRARPVVDTTLTPGASAVATIRLGVEEGVLLLPRGSYLTTGSQKWVYRVEDGRAYKTKVSFGDMEGTEVKVLSGLEAGDEIITSGYQNFIDEDVVVLK